MPHSVEERPDADASAVPGRADAGAARVDVIAVTRSDDLLEQIGASLDGDAAIRPVDSADAAREFIADERAYLALLDARDCADVGPTVEQLLGYGNACVVVVFAPADETTGIAAAIKGSAAFAVLPIPLEAGKTAAVLDGAREEALSRLAVVRSPALAPVPAAAPAAANEPVAVAAPITLSVAADGFAADRATPALEIAEPLATVQASPRTPRTEPKSPTAVIVPEERTPAPATQFETSRRRPPTTALAAGAVLIVLAAVIGGYLAFRPGPEAGTATGPLPSPVATSSQDDAAATDSSSIAPDREPMPQVAVQGTVDELMDRARAAFRERRYTDPAADSALLYYRAVLAREPENGEAIEGLARIGTVLNDRLQLAKSQGRNDDAAAILGQLRLVNPGDASLAALEIEMVEAQLAALIANGTLERAGQVLRRATSEQTLPPARIEHWRGEIGRRQADVRERQLVDLVIARVDEGRLLEPANDSAKFYLGQLQSMTTDQVRRGAATRKLAQAYLQRAQQANAQGQPADAERWLAEARALGANGASVAAVAAESAQATAARAAAEESAQLAQLVQTRIAEGRLLEPRNDSALHHFEALRSLDPDGATTNAQARALSTRLLERARSALDGRSYDAAQAALTGARKVGLRPAEVATLEAALADARRPAAKTPDPVRTAELKRTRYVAPVFPRQALEDGLSGEVRIRITVGTDGRVKDAAVEQSSPPGVFDEAALAAVRRWRFSPEEFDGQPVESTTLQSLVFKPAD